MQQNLRKVSLQLSSIVTKAHVRQTISQSPITNDVNNINENLDMTATIFATLILRTKMSLGLSSYTRIIIS